MADEQPIREPDEAPLCNLHSGFEARLNEHARRLNAGSERMERIEAAINDIRVRLLGRPSWIVTLVITFLAALSAILGTALIQELQINHNKLKGEQISTTVLPPLGEAGGDEGN